MSDPASWPAEILASVGTDDPVATIRRVLHALGYMQPPSSVQINDSGRKALDALIDAEAAEATAYIWSLGAGAEPTEAALRDLRQLMENRVARAIDAVCGAALDRLLVRPDGVATIGPARAAPRMDAVRAERAAYVIAQIVEARSPNLVDAENAFVASCEETLDAGREIDPATAITLERLFEKSRAWWADFATPKGLEKKRAKLQEAADAILAGYRNEWQHLEPIEQEWLEKRVGKSADESEREQVFLLHARAARAKYEMWKIGEAQWLLATWPAGWRNRALFTAAEVSWLDRATIRPDLTIADALYVLELYQAEAEEAA